MLFPIRCYGCSKIIGDKYKKYKELSLKTDKKIWEKLKIKRYCCKKIFLSEIVLYEKIIK